MTAHLHCETHGEGPQEIVVCNGLSQTTANWRGIARQNPQLRWTLFDARGHGKSGTGTRRFTLDLHVGDLIRVIGMSSARNPVLLGFSHGARVALRAAANHGTFFSALIIVSCGSEMTARRKAHVQSWKECLELGGLRAMAWASLPNIVGGKILEKFPDLEFLVKSTETRNRKEGLLAVFEGMATYPPPREDATRVTIPTLIMRGGEDPLVEARDVENLCRWIPHARAGTFEDCGHTLPLEEPRRFVAAIQEFLATVVPIPNPMNPLMEGRQ